MTAPRTTPGDLRHLVQIQSRSTTQDTIGQEVTAWTTVATPFAKIEPALGQETLAGAAVTAAVTHTLTIRYRTGITARMRVLYGTRVFEIVSVIDVEERHFWLELTCVEGQSRG